MEPSGEEAEIMCTGRLCLVSYALTHPYVVHVHVTDVLRKKDSVFTLLSSGAEHVQ